MKTVLLLILSNIFMTLAWYGHLRYRGQPLLLMILISWLIALPEYAIQVPANRAGYGYYTVTQLKIIQECITLVVFTGMAYLLFGERPTWNLLISYLFLVGAVYFAFRG
ncbi:MAG: DMT family protein [candidate division Zixibacteria bacterium]|nr:DMT family protein [candidate division Zixibacteria bacterium]